MASLSRAWSDTSCLCVVGECGRSASRPLAPPLSKLAGDGATAALPKSAAVRETGGLSALGAPAK
eukprot:2255260-Prymnesium_polylepis.1